MLLISLLRMQEVEQNNNILGVLLQDNKPIKLNGAIHSLCIIFKIVAASGAEAELSALFLNTQEAKP